MRRSAGSGLDRPVAGWLPRVLSLLPCVALLRPTHGFELSCANARVPDDMAISFCSSVVNWRAAVMYTHLNTSEVSADSVFSDADQDHIAHRQYSDLVTNAKVTPTCERLLQRFVCAGVFPECSSEGVHVPVSPVCRSLCREAETECGVPLSCDFYHYQGRECTAAMEEGFFVLKEDQGPYEPLPYLYAALLVIWTTITCAWLYQTFVRYRHGGSRLCRLLSCVPIAKVSMMMLSLAFWSTCVKWGYCSFWMGVSLINCQLMYETFSLIGFVLIAKGWCVTRPTFHSNEWRNLVILMCSFYLASSSLLLIRRVILSSVVFWLCTGLLYGSAYTYVIFNVQDRLKAIRRQMRRTLQDSPGDTSRFDLMMLKHWMYQTLSTLLTLFCMTELFFCLLPIVHHIDISGLPSGVKALLTTAAELDARLWLTLVIHEVVEILILFMVGFLFRPRLITAFYYIEMDAVEMQSRHLRPPPLYLIPVSTREYGDGQDVSVSRALLSPTDVTYTRAAYARYGYGYQGSDANALQHGRTASGGATLTRRQPRDVVGGVDAVGAASMGGIVHGAGALLGEQLSPLLATAAAEEAALVKPTPPQTNARYHANQFLVVAQPFGSFAIAVPEHPPLRRASNPHR